MTQSLFIKRANSDMPEKAKLEQDFSNLAFSFVRDRAGMLMKYMIGFEIVESEEDGSRSVGIFGFHVNGKYCYIPAFFVANQIKGVDLLYLKDSDQFVPLRDKWVADVVNRRFVELGKPATIKTRSLSTPDLQRMGTPPQIKTAGEIRTELHQAWGDIQEKAAASLSDRRMGAVMAGVVNSVHHSRVEKVASVLAAGIAEYGGPAARDALLGMLSTNKQLLKAACAFYHPSEFHITSFHERTAPKKTGVELLTKVAADMTDAERRQLLREGHVFRDYRVKTAAVIEVDYRQAVESPSRSGRYRVCLRDGEVEDVWVSVGASCGNSSDDAVIVSQKGEATTARTREVLTVGPSDNQENFVWQRGVTADKVKPQKTYVIADQSGACTGPVKVYSVAGTGSEVFRFQVDSVSTYPAYDRSMDGIAARSNGFPENCNRISEIVVTDKSGKLLASAAGTLYAPGRTCRWLEVDVDPDKKCLLLASSLDVESQWRDAGGSKVSVKKAYDGTYEIDFEGDRRNSGFFSKKEAMCRLIRRGYGVDDAATHLETGGARWVAKTAQVQMQQPSSWNQGYDSVIGTPTEEAQTQVLTNTAAPQPGQPTGPGTGVASVAPGAMTGLVDTATAAADAGQQQVFDYAALGSLAGTYDINYLIDGFLPEMMKALDRVGRTLFLFYWKNEEFASRYGKQDLASMEDKLRSTFKQFGDLILELKQRAIDADTPNSEGTNA